MFASSSSFGLVEPHVLSFVGTNIVQFYFDTPSRPLYFIQKFNACEIEGQGPG